MISKMIGLMVSTMMIQAITGQYLRSGYPGYGNELAANIALADNLAYSQAYGPAIANALTNAPAAELAYESACASARTGLNYGLSVSELGASNGGGLRVQSTSSVAPSGVTVESDNMLIEGPLAVSGQLPFLGVVAMEGPLAAVGEGSVAFGCGNGNVGIVSEGAEALAPAYPNTFSPGYPNIMSPGYPNAIAPGYPNAIASGYSNLLAPGYPNALNNIPALGLVPY